VTLNDRIDYFGQTVNIAARVQRLAGAGEILFTDDVVAGQDAAEVLTDLRITSGDVQLQGIPGEIRVHRIQPEPA
jgi:class 3 adenylate cyclase